MAEVLVQFAEPVVARDGNRYGARACGAEARDGMWQGWIEFLPLTGGAAIRSGRETTQPNRQDTAYWATGLTPIYLEGALERASHPLTRPVADEVGTPLFDAPAPNASGRPPANESVLNPFSVYRKGEALLRRQLGAFSAWHLVNIITAYELSAQSSAVLMATPAPVLTELIVTAVRERAERGGAVV